MLRNAPVKPTRGSALLESRQRTSARKAHEQREMQAALMRDGRQCRWPACEHRSRKLPIDPAHAFKHRGMGGNPKGDLTERKLIVALCRVHHGLIDGPDYEIQPIEDAMADGLLSFWRRSESGRMELVACEARIGVSVTRGL